MTLNEKKALVTYIDDQLMTLCRQMTPHLDSDAIGSLYDRAYELIHDIENTLTSSVELSRAPYASLIKTKR